MAQDKASNAVEGVRGNRAMEKDSQGRERIGGLRAFVHIIRFSALELLNIIKH